MTAADRAAMRDDIVPALSILRAMEVEVQGHECFYRPKLALAINGLLRHLERLKIEGDGTRMDADCNGDERGCTSRG